MRCSGPVIGEQPIEVLVKVRRVPEGQGFDDFRVGGTHLRHQPNPAIAELTFSSIANVEYRFEAPHPAYAYSSHPESSPKFIADDRLEQSGRIRGEISIRCRERIRFDGMGHRDHSWGARHWGIAQHWNM